MFSAGEQRMGRKSRSSQINSLLSDMGLLSGPVKTPVLAKVEEEEEPSPKAPLAPTAVLPSAHSDSIDVRLDQILGRIERVESTLELVLEALQLLRTPVNPLPVPSPATEYSDDPIHAAATARSPQSRNRAEEAELGDYLGISEVTLDVSAPAEET
jgi:hypothetical protein